MSLIIGVDPGKLGAVAVLRRKKLVVVEPTPLRLNKVSGKKEPDLTQMRLAIVRIKAKWVLKDDIYGVIEYQHAFPHQGGVSNFTSGDGYGMWKGLLSGQSVPWFTLGSREWRQMVFEPEELAKTSKSLWLKGEKRKLTNKEKDEIKFLRKQMSLDKCYELLGVKFNMEDDGLAEASLIALAASRCRFAMRAQL